VNLMGVVHGVRAFTPILLEQGEGHIVNTASMAGLISGAGNALYGVTKHAVVALSEALWNELQAQSQGRVRVSVLCPGWINTDIIQSSFRNRPEAVRHHTPEVRTSPEAEIRRKQVEAFLASGLDPRRVGELVLDAVRAERFWILTHPEWKGAIRHRLENVLEERDPTPAGVARR
jgi:short-subunit dehydrogenase